MKLELVMRDLDLADGAAVLQPEWEVSQATLPQGELCFLTPAFITHACEEARIPAPIRDAALAAGRHIAAHPAARALLWHYHHCLYRTPEYPRERISHWPSLAQAMPEEGGMLYLFALVSGLPELERAHRARGVPTEVQRDTVGDINRWFGGQEDAPPRPPWGISPVAVSWLLNHLRGDLYRVGRLQFQFGSFHQQARVFRNRRTRAVVALSADGVSYRADGGRVAQDVEPDAGTWAAQLTVTDEQAMGNPISPDGRTLRETIALSLREWEPVLAPGEPVLHLHIPAGAPLDHAACGESLRRAREFFPKHFPDRPFTAFACGSWLFDVELQRFLPETANIVRFQREFYVLPAPITRGYVYQSVFDKVVFANRVTSLQRAVQDWLNAGHTLRPLGGACFLLPEDLDWGAQVYLSNVTPCSGNGAKLSS